MCFVCSLAKQHSVFKWKDAFLDLLFRKVVQNHRIGEGKQSIVWFLTVLVTLLPKIIVIGSCMSRLHNKSRVELFWDTVSRQMSFISLQFTLLLVAMLQRLNWRDAERFQLLLWAGEASVTWIKRRHRQRVDGTVTEIGQFEVSRRVLAWTKLATRRHTQLLSFVVVASTDTPSTRHLSHCRLRRISICLCAFSLASILKLHLTCTLRGTVNVCKCSVQSGVYF